jgi:hypothetical protein
MSPARECGTRPCFSSIIQGTCFEQGFEFALALRGSLGEDCLIREKYGASLGLGQYLESQGERWARQYPSISAFLGVSTRRFFYCNLPHVPWLKGYAVSGIVGIRRNTLFVRGALGSWADREYRLTRGTKTKMRLPSSRHARISALQLCKCNLEPSMNRNVKPGTNLHNLRDKMGPAGQAVAQLPSACLPRKRDRRP